MAEIKKETGNNISNLIELPIENLLDIFRFFRTQELEKAPSSCKPIHLLTQDPSLAQTSKNKPN